MSVPKIGFQLLFTDAPHTQHVFQPAATDARIWRGGPTLGPMTFLAVAIDTSILRRLPIRTM